ncbi:MAG: hypothetical protein COA78_12615 [Blastopirellula sp.]|nr:MAG: hypothetical protein COA78_12615 [Blastopirellula sp.]
MVDSIKHKRSDWRNWSALDWNRVLFDHFFHDAGDHTPVSRIAINNDLLQRLVGEESANDQVYETFRNAICQAVGDKNIAREIDTLGQCDPSASERPREFVYLAVTCYVATHATESGSQGNFRCRLKEFLRQDTIDQNYCLNGLPVAWERLQRWLYDSIENGRSHRRLILRPQTQNIKIIGYSLDLGFPSHQDHQRLVATFASHALSSSPPVIRVLQIIDQRLGKFSDRFQKEYWCFRNAFESGHSNLCESPFWSAVREAIIEKHTETTSHSKSAIRILLRLDRKEDWRFGLSVFLDDTPPSEMTAVPAMEHAIQEFKWVLSTVQNKSATPAEWVIDGHSHESLLRNAAVMRRVINEGILLFEPNEDDVWILSTSFPKSDRIRALIRRDVNDRIGNVLTSCGALPRKSRYENWFEIEQLSRSKIEDANLRALLPEADVLQLTVDEPSLRIRGGVRTQSGWLGLRACLPTISTSADSVIVTATFPSMGDEYTCTKLDESGTFEFPVASSGSGDLDGECIIRGWQDETEISRKNIRFDSRVLSCSYKNISDPSSWLCEGGTIDVDSPNADLSIPNDIANTENLSTQFVSGLERSGANYSNSAKVNSLIEILAGQSLHRGLLNASEVVKWFYNTLQLKDQKYVWDIIRSWTEAGAIDQFSHRNWRCTSYRARRPRFVITRAEGKLPICCVLHGLAPFAIEEAIRRAASGKNVEIERHQPINEFALAPLVLFASDTETITSISRAATIGSPEYLHPITQLVSSCDELELNQQKLRKNHVPNGEWDWDSHFFTSSMHTSSSGVKRFSREDSPDSYVVPLGDSKVIHTLSKTWALLLGAVLQEQGAYTSNFTASNLLMHPGIYLPLPIGRWTTVTTGVSPGFGEKDRYEYRFSNKKIRDQIIMRLWNTSLPKEILRQMERVVQVCYLNRSQSDQVPVPPKVIETLQRYSTDLTTQRLVSMRRVSRRLLPQLLRMTSVLLKNSAESWRQQR